MTLAVPRVRVGDPIRYESLSVFPLFTEAAGGVDYLLSDEALQAQSLVVEEVSESGSVPNLLVENKGDTRVLFIEGEQLIGAKQNRILNTSILVAAHAKTKIPVSCVEQGRWGYKSRHFASGGTHSPSKLRYALKASVLKSLKAKQGFRSDQGEVWREVSRQQSALGATSDSMAMADSFLACSREITDYRQNIKYVAGATGVAVAIGKKVVAVDLFDKPSTYRKVWDRLLTGYVLDAVEAGSEQEHALAGDVEQLLGVTTAAKWEQVEAVGEGEEYRAEIAQDHASALAFQGALVHESVVVAG